MRLLPPWTRLALLPLALAGPVAGQEIPVLRGHVVDDGDLIGPGTELEIATLLSDHERATTDQIVVLTVPSLNGDSVEDYALKVARSWQLGQAEADNGVLFVIAAAERKLRIEVGRGLEGTLTDVQSSRILRERVRPHLADDDYDTGVDAGVRAIVDTLTGGALAVDGEELASDTSTGAGGVADMSPGGRFAFAAFLILALAVGGFLTILSGGGGFRWIPFVFPLLPFAATLGQVLFEAPLAALALYLGGWSTALYFHDCRARGRLIGSDISDWFFNLLPSGGGSGSGSGRRRDDEWHTSSQDSSPSYSGGGGDFAGGGASEDY